MITRKQWSGLNFQNIKKKHLELEEYDEYIPLIFHNHINSYHRMQYLKKNNKKILNETTLKRNDFKKSKDKSEWVIRDVLKWVNKHSEHTDLIKTK